MPGFLDHWYILLILLVIVLIIWGPGKLPDVGAGMGRAIREFRKASSETQEAFKAAASTPPVPQPSPTAPSPALNGPAASNDQPVSSEPKQQTPVSS